MRFAAGYLTRVGLRQGLDVPIRLIAAITLLATSITVVSVRAEAPAFALRTPGELVGYDFREGGGDTVFDVSGVGVAVVGASREGKLGELVWYEESIDPTALRIEHPIRTDLSGGA